MTSELNGRIGLITGAGAGIGKATAFSAANEGAELFLTDLDRERVEQTAEQILEQGGAATAIQADVSDPASVEKLFGQIRSESPGLHFAFNNAGVEGPQKTVDEVSLKEWQHTIGVNLTGAWLCLREELRMMTQETGPGAIVNMSSIAGRKGFSGISTYTASKHGVIGLTKSAALEYAKEDVRINAICPGAIDTDMIDRVSGGDSEAKKQYLDMEPIGRLGTSEEIAEAVIWLFSDRSSFVTGECLVADGGIMAG